MNAYYFSLCACQRILCYKKYMFLLFHLRIQSLMICVLDNFHIRKPFGLFSFFIWIHI